MRKLDHNVANGATEWYIADGYLEEESRMLRQAACQRQPHSSQHSACNSHLQAVHKATFKEAPIQNYIHTHTPDLLNAHYHCLCPDFCMFEMDN